MTRAVPHIVGNFHSLVYIRVPVDDETLVYARKAANLLRRLNCRAKLDDCIPARTQENSDSDDTDEEGANQGNAHTKKLPEHLHLSLCKPVYLKRQFIKPFTDRLEEALRNHHDINERRFYLLLDTNIAICANEEHNSYFAVLPVEAQCRKRSVLGTLMRSSNMQVVPLIDAVDSVVELFGYDRYYEQRQPHVSLANICQQNLKHVMQRLYAGHEDGDGDLYSSHHWRQAERFLNDAQAADDAQARDGGATENDATGTNGHSIDNRDVVASHDCEGTKEVRYTFYHGDLLTHVGDDGPANPEPLCVYVEDIHVQVGSQTTVIKLSKSII
ncbi:hypothetical protein, conserved [Babesia bigemina]|uniref:U6 snRNA phosphodiesterase 1 n=1 Tax=Babesia bigemina TaxID=5866 RepID=A0A061DCL8_BABBI|nr:hypothetical protein, conserved [Babesia bigemina]CDR95645.1 hypothetical protein, conserved [Babesia bigemina]|eukprot:XP_012767831.1 hypothetical protein, conserved [Babesia bigemina]